MPKDPIIRLSSLRFFSLHITCIMLAITISVPASHAAELTTLQTDIGKNSSSVTLKLDEQVNYTGHQLPATDKEPPRCYIDLPDTTSGNRIKNRYTLNSDQFINVRIGRHKNKTRVVLDLVGDTKCYISSLNNPYRIVMSSVQTITAKTSEPDPPTITKNNSLQKQNTTVAAATSIMITQPAKDLSSQQETATVLTDDDFTSSSADWPTDETSNFSMWGWLQGYAAYDFKDDPYEDDRFNRLSARLGIDHEQDLGSVYSLQVRASVNLDHLNYADPRAGEANEANLHTTYLQLNSTNWELSAGKQTVRWGKSDQLSPVDSINPQDLRQFLTVDLEERKLPVLMARLKWFGDSTSFETIVTPWFEKSEIDYFDSDWSLYRNLRKTITDNPQLPAAVRQYAAEIRVHETEPDNSLKNSSVAARITWQINDIDFGLSYRYGWETNPTITSFPVKNINYSGASINPALLLGGATLTSEEVESTWKRQQVAGLEWETVFDLIGLRGELVWFDQVAFLSSDLTSQRNAATHLVIGIDYTSTEEWYLNLQGSWYKIHNYEQSILYLQEDNLSILGEIRKPVWRGNLELALKYNYTLTDESGYLQPSVTLKYFPNIECEVGADIFSGKADTLMGSYDHADQAYARIKLFF